MPPETRAPGRFCLDPAGGLDEIDGVVDVFLEAGGDGEDVGIENNVLGGEADFVDQDLVGALADFDAAREGIGLALFVEGHDDGGGAVTADEFGAFAEDGLAFLEAERIDDGLAGDAAEARLDHAPLGAVDHDRHAGDLGFGGDEIEEMGHRLFAVEHAFVHVDVDDGGAALDLLPRDGEGLVEFPVEDELGELGRAGDVGAFADEGERNFGAEGEGFEAGVLGEADFLDGINKINGIVLGRFRIASCALRASGQQVARTTGGERPGRNAF